MKNGNGNGNGNGNRDTHTRTLGHLEDINGQRQLFLIRKPHLVQVLHLAESKREKDLNGLTQVPRGYASVECIKIKHIYFCKRVASVVNFISDLV